MNRRGRRWEGCTEGEEQEHLDVQKGGKLEGDAGLQRKGTEKGGGRDVCIHVNRRVGVV